MSVYSLYDSHILWTRSDHAQVTHFLRAFRPSDQSKDLDINCRDSDSQPFRSVDNCHVRLEVSHSVLHFVSSYPIALAGDELDVTAGNSAGEMETAAAAFFMSSTPGWLKQVTLSRECNQNT